LKEQCIAFTLQYLDNRYELTCKVLIESLTGSIGTYVPARYKVRRGVRTTAARVLHIVIKMDKGTSPRAINVTCNTISARQQ